mmetsp:Transcript_27094/g.31257  ORF Transcript_27094/g.31257 Transcript_27094/m.31257 type:complete len:239 (-) Transcript_27094:827-1543(-)
MGPNKLLWIDRQNIRVKCKETLVPLVIRHVSPLPSCERISKRIPKPKFESRFPIFLIDESRVISIDPKIEAFLTSLKLGDLVPYFQGLHFEQFSVLSKEDMLNGGIPMGVTLKVCQALHFLHSRQASQRMEEYVKTPPGLDVSSSRTSTSPKEILGEEAFSSFQDASSRAIGRREGSSAGASANASANSSMISKKPLQEMNTTSSSTPSSSGNTTERKEENKGNFSFNFEGMISFLDE